MITVTQVARDAISLAHDMIAAEHSHGIHAAADIIRCGIDAAKAEQREADARVLDERAAMYREKRNGHDPMGNDSLNQWEKFQGYAEAADWSAAAIREGTET